MTQLQNIKIIESICLKKSIIDLTFRSKVHPKLFSNKGMFVLFDDLTNLDYLLATNCYDTIMTAFKDKYSHRSWYKNVSKAINDADVTNVDGAYSDLLKRFQYTIANSNVQKLKQSLSESYEDFLHTIQEINAIHSRNSLVENSSKTLHESFVLGLGSRHIIFPTPFLKLNRILSGGYSSGRLHLIGARTSVGKTSLATEITAHIAINQPDTNPVFISLEMSYGEMAARFMMSLNINRKAPLEKVLLSLKKHKTLHIACEHTATILSIESLVKNIKSKFIVIDYIGLINYAHIENTSDPLYKKLGELSKGLKRLAMKYNICILALAQLKRPASMSGKKYDVEPNLADLRESGDFEQDADTVTLIHRPNPTSNEAEILLRKNRHGPCGDVPVRFVDGRFFNHQAI